MSVTPEASSAKTGTVVSTASQEAAAVGIEPDHAARRAVEDAANLTAASAAEDLGAYLAQLDNSL